MDLANLKYLVVGAGFFGAVVAERLAAERGERVMVIDRKPHIGGNSFSADDPATGIECHSYGSHIFHTASREVWQYINRFTDFNSYRHRVLTCYQGEVYQMPINLETLNRFYGKTMTPAVAAALLAEEVAAFAAVTPHNLEEKAISQIGRPLYEAFIRGYTCKQWQTDPKQLPAEIINRLPVRFSYKSDYFNDPWQGIPLDGYHALFRRLLAHPNITTHLNTDFFAIREQIPSDCTIIYTGPLDRFFDYRFGRLGWRTLDFEKEIIPMGDFQGTTVMNYAEETVPFTRIHEFRHYHEERLYPADRTVIYREFSRSPVAGDELYYPVNTLEDRRLLSLYQEACRQAPGVLFGGRLGSYQYLDMDKTIAAALQLYERRLK